MSSRLTLVVAVVGGMLGGALVNGLAPAAAQDGVVEATRFVLRDGSGNYRGGMLVHPSGFARMEVCDVGATKCVTIDEDGVRLWFSESDGQKLRGTWTVAPSSALDGGGHLRLLSDSGNVTCDLSQQDEVGGLVVGGSSDLRVDGISHTVRIRADGTNTYPNSDTLGFAQFEVWGNTFAQSLTRDLQPRVQMASAFRDGNTHRPTKNALSVHRVNGKRRFRK